MSKYRTIDVWNEFYGKRESVYDDEEIGMRRSEQRISPDARSHQTAVSGRK